MDLEVAEWCENADLAVPLPLHPGPGGLFPRSSFNQGDFFVRMTRLAGP